MANAPCVSVVLPVYNRERYVTTAIDSILGQTFDDLELIVVDDGSSDGTCAALRASADRDPRVRVLRNERNLGIPASRNLGIDAARGEFLAIMDSDDRAHPRRLEMQIAFLRRRPECAAVGSWASWMDEDGRLLGRIRRRPLAPDDVRAMLLFRCSLQNSSSTVRTEIARQFRYREEFDLSEDFDFWVRISAHHSLANLPEPLVCFRRHLGLTSRTKKERVEACQRAIFREQLNALGIRCGNTDLGHHLALVRLEKLTTPVDPGYAEWARDWLLNLQRANAERDCYPRAAFNRVLGWVWWRVCRDLAGSGNTGAWTSFFSTPLWHHAPAYACHTLWEMRFLPAARRSAAIAFGRVNS